MTLATAAYAKRRIAQGSFTAAEDALVDELLAATSNAIRRFCQREFNSQTFDELYHGLGRRELLLRQFPVASVARVATGLTTVLAVTNASAANQRATVAVTSTGLALVRVSSGVATADVTVTFAGNPTLEAVQNAVNALGHGWSAALPDPAKAHWASADLRNVQGALNAKNVAAELQIHVDEVSGYEVDAASGILYRAPAGEHPHAAAVDALVWTPGVNNYRVIYAAGFAAVPEAVQEACAIWTAALYWQAKRDPGLTQDAMPGAYQRSNALISHGGMLPHVKTLLAPFMKRL